MRKCEFYTHGTLHISGELDWAVHHGDWTGLDWGLEWTGDWTGLGTRLDWRDRGLDWIGRGLDWNWTGPLTIEPYFFLVK